MFQDPISSLNPRRKVKDIVAEGLRIHGEAPDDSVIAGMLDAVGLDPEQVGDRRPNEFSGGQCQRISIARALVLSPELLICDEPVSALDVSVQAQLLNLLSDLKEQFSLTLLFIAHDLAVVRYIADRAAVMYAGRLCEVGAVDSIFDSPAHPYTRELIDAIPTIEAEWQSEPAEELVSSAAPPAFGFPYHDRCPRAQDRCKHEQPSIRRVDDGLDHFVASHFPLR